MKGFWIPANLAILRKPNALEKQNRCNIDRGNPDRQDGSSMKAAIHLRMEMPRFWNAAWFWMRPFKVSIHCWDARRRQTRDAGWFSAAATRRRNSGVALRAQWNRLGQCQN